MNAEGNKNAYIKDMTLEEFKKLMRTFMKSSPMEHTLEQLFLSEIISLDNPNKVVVKNFFLIVDMYNFWPMIIKKDKNLSKEIYLIMTANKHGGFEDDINDQKKRRCEKDE